MLLLGASLLAMTMIVPLLVWPMTNWRTALEAWKAFGAWMGALYFLGAVVWFFMAITSRAIA